MWVPPPPAPILQQRCRGWQRCIRGTTSTTTPCSRRCWVGLGGGVCPKKSRDFHEIYGDLINLIQAEWGYATNHFMKMSLDVMRKIWYNGWFPFVSWQIWWVRYDLTKIHTIFRVPYFGWSSQQCFYQMRSGESSRWCSPWNEVENYEWVSRDPHQNCLQIVTESLMKTIKRYMNIPIFMDDLSIQHPFTSFYISMLCSHQFLSWFAWKPSSIPRFL